MSAEGKESEKQAAFAAHILTLYPDMFPGPLGHSLAGRGLANGDWSLDVTQIRDFTEDRHHTVDGPPFGGGAGMVMRPDILANAIDATLEQAGPVDRLIYFSPRGRQMDQAYVRELAASRRILCICGRFEGVDERLLETRNIEEVSLGDFILSGGEVAALALLDAVVRLLPGVTGNKA